MPSPDVRPALSRRSLLKFGSLLAAGGAVGGALSMTGVASAQAEPALAAPRIHWAEVPCRASAGLLSGVASKGTAYWAVGSIGDGEDVRPLAMRLVNRTWRPTAQPAPDLASLASVAVVSATDVWAVGEQLIPDSGDTLPVIVRWNGTSWRKVAFPATIGGLDHVVAIGGSIWVAGWAKVGSAEHGVVYRRTNGTWRRLDKGLEESINVNCLQIFDDGTAWAGLNPGMAHFDGTSWTLSPEWPQDGSMIASKFVARGADDVYVAGLQYTGNGNVVPLISHYNGSRWSARKTPAVQGQLYDLARYGDGIVAVGERFADDGTVTQLQLAGDGNSFLVENGPTTRPGGLLALLDVSDALLTTGYLNTPQPQPYSAVSQARWTMTAGSVG